MALSSSSIVFSDANSCGDEDAEQSLALAPPTLLHVLMTLFLWSTSLCIAIGFEDVSVVLALSGDFMHAHDAPSADLRMTWWCTL